MVMAHFINVWVKIGGNFVSIVLCHATGCEMIVVRGWPALYCYLSHLLSLPLIRCGPIFGAGADLYISSECNLNKDSYSNLLHSYGSPHSSVHSLASSYSFQIEDYEVFKPAYTCLLYTSDAADE